MRNLCQIFCVKRKICAAALVFCLMCGLTPPAESISVKLRGKIALAGILSGLAYLTHTLVKRDRQAMEKLEFRLGPPDRVVQFERGFDLWRINYYREQSYLFRNNRFVPKKGLKVPFSYSIEPFHWNGWNNKSASDLPIFQSSRLRLLPSFIDTPVSRNPKWSRLYLWHLQPAPRPVSSDLYLLEAERLLGPRLSLSH